MSLFILLSPKASAQSSEEAWELPVNLSHSGLASDPVLVVDGSGITHVFWLDLLEGVVYTKGDGEQWDAPKLVSPPFETTVEDSGGGKGGNQGGDSSGNVSGDKTGKEGGGSTAGTTAPVVSVEANYAMFVPTLIADQTGKIHAFWINEENELFYSSVMASSVTPTKWTAALRLAESIQDFEVYLDSQNRLHVAYIPSFNSTKYSAGVFYRVKGASTTWSNPVSLYTSRYFRTITQAEANVDIAVVESDDSQRIFVVWDNQPRNQVFFTQSRDDGDTWGTPVEIQGPGPSLQAIKPYGIKVTAEENNIILLWQEEESAVSCRQYFQVSKDGGETWEPPQRMLEDLPGCPETNQFRSGEEGLILLETTLLNQIYLVAWDGEKWSDPQPQQAISNFIDPETHNPLDIQCRKTTLVGGNHLLLVGCDVNSSQDIWFTSRSLDDVSPWFPVPSEWRLATSVATGLPDLSSLAMVSDNQGRLHAVWSQQESSLITGDEGNAINYARWDTDRWIVLSAVLVPPLGRARELDAAIDAKERLFVVWSGGESGEIYASWANASFANSTLEWATPTLLPSPREVGSSPEILIDEVGAIYVVYAIPLNENRGVYLTKSIDEGETWSEPIRIFDGVAAGWEMVSQPHLSRTSNGSLHVLWTQSTLPGGNGPTALYYSRSEDNGDTWTESEVVVEAPIIWSQIRGVGENTVHRVWQETQNDLPVIWFEVSMDNGQTWTRPTNISGLGPNHGSAALTIDSMGHLHLLQLSEEVTQNLILREWVWDGVSWTSEVNLDLGMGTLSDGSLIAADITPTGFLAALVSKKVMDPTSGQEHEEIISTGRSLELPLLIPTQPPSPTIAPPPTEEITATPDTAPTPTRVALSQEGEKTFQPATPTDGFIQKYGPLIGVMAAGLVVVATFFVSLRSRKNN